MSAPRLCFPLGGGGGGGGIGGGGTPNSLAMFTAANTISDSAIVQAAGAIASLTNLGAAATTGTYSQVALTGGSGTRATADVVVTASVVTSITLRNPGQGYVVGDNLACAAIGAAGNVATVASVTNYAGVTGNVYASQRIGAGTTRPRAAVDVAAGGLLATSVEKYTRADITGAWALWNSSIAAIPTITAASTITSSYGAAQFAAIFDMTGSTVAPTCYGARVSGEISGWPAGVAGALYGHLVDALRASASDLSTSLNIFAVQPQLRILPGLGAATTNNAIVLNAIGNLQASPHTVNNFWVYRASSSTAVGVTVGTFSFFDAAPVSAASTITTLYGLRLQATTAPTITNRWGISQEDPLAKTRHYGNLGVGNALDVGAGKVIGSLTLTNGGTGYTNGSYFQVALTTVTGTGTGATADIVVAGGIVTTVVLRAPGQGYAVGDTLSCASIGAGSNFLLTVATTASILRSDGTVVGTRVGAGTTTPVSALHANGLFTISTNEDCVAQFSASNVRVRAQSLLTSQYLTNGVNQPPAGNSNINIQDIIVQRFDSSLLSGSTTSIGQYIQNTLFDFVSSNIFHWGVQAQAVVANTALTGKTINGVTGVYGLGSIQNVGATNVGTLVQGVQANAQVSGTLAPITVTTMHGLASNTFTTGAAHSITDAHLFYGSATFSSGTVSNFYGLRLLAPTGVGTLTNRYPIAQEDTLGANYVRAKTHFGAAVGTAAATNASVEVTAQGTLNGDIRLNSANAVVDVSAASTNGVKFNNRGGAGITSTTQNWYEEGTYTPTFSAAWTPGSFTATWTRIGRKVFITINFAAGTTNGTSGAATITVPVGLTPARPGAGIRARPDGTASGNGVVGVDTAGLIQISTAITLDTNAKVIQCEYEV